jgi:hypothetical protein
MNCHTGAKKATICSGRTGRLRIASAQPETWKRSVSCVYSGNVSVQLTTERMPCRATACLAASWLPTKSCAPVRGCFHTGSAAARARARTSVRRGQPRSHVSFSSARLVALGARPRAPDPTPARRPERLTQRVVAACSSRLQVEPREQLARLLVEVVLHLVRRAAPPGRAQERPVGAGSPRQRGVAPQARGRPAGAPLPAAPPAAPPAALCRVRSAARRDQPGGAPPRSALPVLPGCRAAASNAASATPCRRALAPPCRAPTRSRRPRAAAAACRRRAPRRQRRSLLPVRHRNSS